MNEIRNLNKKRVGDVSQDERVFVLSCLIKYTFKMNLGQ